MDKVARYRCEVCDEQTRHTAPGMNHLLHFFITMCTLGMWSIVWLGMGVEPAKNFACDACGTQVTFRNRAGVVEKVVKWGMVTLATLIVLMFAVAAYLQP